MSFYFAFLQRFWLVLLYNILLMCAVFHATCLANRSRELNSTLYRRTLQKRISQRFYLLRYVSRVQCFMLNLSCKLRELNSTTFYNRTLQKRISRRFSVCYTICYSCRGAEFHGTCLAVRDLNSTLYNRTRLQNLHQYLATTLLAVHGTREKCFL